MDRFNLIDFISKEVEVVIDYKLRGLCGRSYRKHPKGCPNFGKKNYCPPKVGFFDKYFQPLARVVAVGMNFEDYKEKRKKDHPNWTEWQLVNPLYWQGMMKARLKQLATYELEELKDKDLVVVNVPEAMGVNLTETCKRAGLILEWPPTKMVYKVILLAKEL